MADFSEAFATMRVGMAGLALCAMMCNNAAGQSAADGGGLRGRPQPVGSLPGDGLIGQAAVLAVPPATPVFSVGPVRLAAPGRPVDLELRVSAPVSGSNLPILLLSHGHGSSNYLSSMYGYGPLATFFAAHGFVVLQPTHLDSKLLQLPRDGPEGPLYWRSRALDMRLLLDRLDEIEAAVPELRGRLDRTRVAVLGHSMGGNTAALLLGERMTDPKDGKPADLRDPRIQVGLLLGAPGDGGADLSPHAATEFPIFQRPDFSQMTAPALVVAGDADLDTTHYLTMRGADWTADPYRLSPGPKCLLTLAGGKHGLGGVAGYDAKETTDEDPERVAVLERLGWAYLRTALYPGDPAWAKARATFSTNERLGHIGCK